MRTERLWLRDAVAVVCAMQTRALRKIVLASIVGVVCMVPAFAAKPHTAAEQIARLAIPSTSWQPTQVMALSGVVFHALRFSSTGTLAGVGQALIGNGQMFQHVLAIPQGLVLSGFSEGRHWLAEVQAGPSGTSGRVSAMDVSGSTMAASNPSEAPSYDWLPVNSVPLLNYRDLNSDGILQYVFRVPMPVEALSAYLRESLRTSGWKAEASLAGLHSHDTWLRHGKRLTVAPTVDHGASLLYVALQEG